MSVKKTKKKVSKKGTLKKINTQVQTTTKKMVDQILTKISPSVEKQLQQLSDKFDNSPLNLSDIKMLGLKVLQRTRALSAAASPEKEKPAKVKSVKNMKSKKK